MGKRRGWRRVAKKLGGQARRVAADVVGTYTGGLIDLHKKQKAPGEEDFRGEAAGTLVKKNVSRQGGSGQVKFNTEVLE